MARPISGKYRRRVIACGRETLTRRNKARGIMKRALQQGTEEEVYDRTTLKTTRRLFKSILTRFAVGGVEVYYDGAKAPHARARVNMTGLSKLGGHILNMNPALAVRKYADPALRAMNRLSQKRITGGR